MHQGTQGLCQLALQLLLGLTGLHQTVEQGSSQSQVALGLTGLHQTVEQGSSPSQVQIEVPEQAEAGAGEGLALQAVLSVQPALTVQSAFKVVGQPSLQQLQLFSKACQTLLAALLAGKDPGGVLTLEFPFFLSHMHVYLKYALP